MTFILISSSGTMAMRSFRLRRDRVQMRSLDVGDGGIWPSFVGMQAFEWTKLIMEGSPLGNPWERLSLAHAFLDHGLPRHPRDDRRDFLLIHRAKSLAGRFRQRKARLFHQQEGRYEIVETMGLYWHFVDLVWVFIFALFYLW